MSGARSDGRSEFLTAAARGDVERVRELLARDAELVDATEDFDRTALHCAAECDDRALAELLIEAGADVDARTTWGHTPLGWAAVVGARAVGELLLARRPREIYPWTLAGLGRLDRLGEFWRPDGTLEPARSYTCSHREPHEPGHRLHPVADYETIVSDALYLAGRNGHTEVVEWLLERGARIAYRGHFGGTALMWAAFNGHFETVESLVARGADPARFDRRFFADASDWAREGGHPEIALWLEGGEEPGPIAPRPVDVEVRVNGVVHRRPVEPRLLLSDFLRHELQLTGTHVGCEHGACGACTVLFDGVPVRSCLMFAVQADGHEVGTVEGLADGLAALHPIQQAFQDEHGLQCGFCTPGILMTLVPFLAAHPDPGDEEIRAAISGNLCRCTGYHNIVAAVRRAAEMLREEGAGGDRGGPRAVDDAVTALDRGEDADERGPDAVEGGHDAVNGPPPVDP